MSILNHYSIRIDWSGVIAVNIDTLRVLHLKHNCTIPFENLGVSLLREIQPDNQSSEEKPVIAHRGGYCSEQDGVFERVLRELGFSVRGLLGRAVLSNPPALPSCIYRLLLAELEGGKRIADVSFGGRTLITPARLISDLAQTTPHGEHRLLQEGDGWVLQFNRYQYWQSMYRSDLYEQQRSDYVMGSFWLAHWPQPHFRHHLPMCRYLPDGGKLTLTNFYLTRYENGHAVEQRNLLDVALLCVVMQGQFGLGVDDAKHGFAVGELTPVVTVFDTHPEVGR